MITPQETWNRIKSILKNELDQDVYESYFESINEVYKEQNNTIYLITDSLFTKTRVQNTYLPRMNSLLSEFYSEPHYFSLIAVEEIEKEKSMAIKEINFSHSNPSGLNPNYTFSTFVVGDSNRLAHRYALLTAEQLAGVANPVYIFGDVGLGKTHLMQSIGNYILETKPDKKVLYVRTQDFVEEYVKAGRDSGYEEFSQKFSNIDVLLVDDVQFLESKKQCQIEFFKIFERLTGDKKLIVLTSDRKASELKDIMARLTSRFEWGISLDINKPNKEHRINILKAKLKQEMRNPEEFSEDIIEYIAGVCENNIRELEGALKRVLFYCEAFEQEYTLDVAKEALKNIVSTQETIVAAAPSHDLRKMLDIVGAYFKIDQDELLSNSRKKNIVYARQLCWYIMRTKYDLTFKKIGDIFNGKDHSTVMHGFQAFEQEYKDSEETQRNVENILRKMGKNPDKI